MRARDWSSLPAELVDAISSHLSTDADQVHVHQVCSHWRASTSPPAAPRPWVVAGRPLNKSDAWSGPASTFSLWLPRGRIPVDVQAPDHLMICCGAPRGWLALADDTPSPTRFILWEPISRREIPLHCLRDVVQVFLSADPSSSENWVAIASQRIYSGGFVLRYWRPGDSSWRELSHPYCSPCPYNSFAFHQGRGYLADKHGYIFNHNSASPPQRTCTFGARFVLSRFDGWHRSHAVSTLTCNDELLIVGICDWWGRPRTARVFRVTMRGETVMAGLGEQVTDLGEYSIFLGWGDAFALSAAAFPGIKRNHVYFLENGQPEQKYWMTIYDLASGVCSEQVPYPEEHKNNGSNWLPCTWFCPRRPFLKQ